jgi:prepilin-type N-terminal cleavage/methylation domain-containing protein
MGIFFILAVNGTSLVRRRTPCACSCASSWGYSLIELLFTIAVLGACLAAGSVGLVHGLRNEEARGAAQSWQAAASWAQIGVLWQGGSTETGYAAGSLAAANDLELSGGDFGPVAPKVPVRTNVCGWRESEGVAVSFAGSFAAPNGGGSLYFDACQGSYRVVVRPESGLTTRARVSSGP